MENSDEPIPLVWIVSAGVEAISQIERRPEVRSRIQELIAERQAARTVLGQPTRAVRRKGRGARRRRDARSPAAEGVGRARVIHARVANLNAAHL